MSSVPSAPFDCGGRSHLAPGGPVLGRTLSQGGEQQKQHMLYRFPPPAFRQQQQEAFPEFIGGGERARPLSQASPARSSRGEMPEEQQRSM